MPFKLPCQDPATLLSSGPGCHLTRAPSPVWQAVQWPGFAGGFLVKCEQSKGTEACHQDTYRDTRTAEPSHTGWLPVGHSGHPQGFLMLLWVPVLWPSHSSAGRRTAGKKDDENSCPFLE